MKNPILFFLLVLALFSCQPSGKESKEIDSKPGVVTLDSLKKEVLAIHDEVMPKMGQLMKTSKALITLADSVSSSDSIRASTLMEAANDIDLANENMMVWMRNYEPAFEGSEAEILAYLTKQKKEIQKVKDDMEGSLANGRKMLSND